MHMLSLHVSRLTCSHLSIKNRGGCDALRDDLADFIDAVAVSTSASLALACLTVLETRRQLDDLAIFVDEGKNVSLLACKLCMCNASELFRSEFVLSPHLAETPREESCSELSAILVLRQRYRLERYLPLENKLSP